ncbi:hypothetical protein [Priestia megaterium]|uniref:hypothetical protein n=1 Tax=Priestia megaterium TaxID=1404 RepID=UPI0025B149D6|nr:hypothetical protein [Priestia megaterium]MDN3229511.1 hypothetical protein [Priestia megaterium]
MKDKKMRITISQCIGDLTNLLCNRCKTRNKCNECPVKGTLRMLGQALESSPDKVIGPLTVNLYKDMQADGLTEQQIAELAHMSGKELLNFKHNHGLFAKKLTTNDIREIRRLREEENLSLREISKRFDSNQGFISRIVNYKTYTKVK